MAAAANDPGAASGVLAPRLVRLAHHDYPDGLLANQRPPGACPDPAHVGGERIHVHLGDEALEGGHPDRLPLEEPAADRVLGDPRELAPGDPAAQLVLAAHQVVEVGAPEAGHVALERARVPHPPGAERAVAGEAAEVARQLGAPL